MSGFYQDVLTGITGTLFGSDFLRDYTHASKTFRTDLYGNAPKFKFLFHVYFEVNHDVYRPQNWNYGLLVKTVKLPSFSVDVATMNQYNRKRLIQSKIKYDPIDITFHDDNDNTIRNMWIAYYNYYYADGRKPQVVFGGARGVNLQTQLNGGGGFSTETDATYNSRNQYQPSLTGNIDWGYIGESSDPTGTKIPFFKNITVFGFNRHNFSAYTLINPLITRFSHDTYDYNQANGIMEQRMSVDYETVVYNEGAIDGRSPSNIVTGFGLEENYDRTLSPIARPGSQANILGQGGLVDGVGGTLKALADGNILGAVVNAGTTVNTFKNVNVLKVAKSEAVGAIINAVRQTPDRNIFATFPIFGATPQVSGTAGSPISGQSSPKPVGQNTFAGQQTHQ